jgi:hypothetical protein
MRIVLLFAFLLLDLGEVTFDLHQASQDISLLLLPATGYLSGRLRASFRRDINARRSSARQNC